MTTILPSTTPVTPKTRRRKSVPELASPLASPPLADPADSPAYFVGVAAKRNDPAYAAIWSATGKYVREQRTSKKRADFVYAPRVVGSSVQRIVDRMSDLFPDARYEQNAAEESRAQTEHAARKSSNDQRISPAPTEENPKTILENPTAQTGENK